METTAERLSKWLVRAFFALALLLMGGMFLCGLLAPEGSVPYTVLFFLLTAACAGLLCFFTLRYGKKLNNRRFFLLIACVLALMAVIQLLAARSLAVEPSWDFGGVYVSAREYVNYGRVITHEHYFERFYNNAGLLMLEIVYFKLLTLLGFTPYIGWGILLNVALIDAAILFMLLFCRKVWGNARAALVLAISFCFLPYYLYAPIFYTDSISMVFLTLPLYLFACLIKAKRRPVRLALAVAIGLIFSFGMKVKATVAIMLVAMLLYVIFNFGIKRIAAFFLAVLLPFAGFSVLFDGQVRRMGIVKEEQELTFKFPTEYWLFMGLKNPGGFNEADFEYIYAQPDYDAKQQAAREGISQRAADYGISGLLDHFRQKAAFTFNDGTYFTQNQLFRKPLHDSRLHEFVFWNGKYYTQAKAFQDAYHFVILVLLLAGMVLGLRKCRFDFTTLLYVALFGLSVFLMLWETRSRYLTNFTPVFLMLAADSLVQLGAAAGQLVKRRTSRHPIDSPPPSAGLQSPLEGGTERTDSL